MVKPEDYKTLHESESYGTDGQFALKIQVAATKLPDLKSKEIRMAVYKAQELISSVVRGEIKKADPKTAIATLNNRRLVDDVFDGPIFVEEIPNGYCKDWCCQHLPWFVVTTCVGRFAIGWRKRVISIDWSETVGTASYDTLFPNEDTTKGTSYIHAWSIEDAKRYVDEIVGSAFK